MNWKVVNLLFIMHSIPQDGTVENVDEIWNTTD